MSDRYSVTDTRLQTRPQCTQVTFQETNCHLGTPIRLRIVLWGMLLQCLLEALDPEVSQRLNQKLNNGRFVIAFKCHSRTPKPLDILNEDVDGKALLVNALGPFAVRPWPLVFNGSETIIPTLNSGRGSSNWKPWGRGGAKPPVLNRLERNAGWRIRRGSRFSPWCCNKVPLAHRVLI